MKIPKIFQRAEVPNPDPIPIPSPVPIPLIKSDGASKEKIEQLEKVINEIKESVSALTHELNTRFGLSIKGRS